MIQHVGRQFRLSREMKPFIVEDVDHLFFACRYEGSNEGFVIEKDAFHRQVQRGRIVAGPAQPAIAM
ncbi:hypothetical protein [Aneurinibacillus tyrosinisolvens]|uniref:hypothetical protein n=1 Tax=Aneurinibacillus tyrosinisolvens TaxID=1443435 RepID=UPI00063F7E68|nr:hypothetical protein [Aneurinibacillus tyrosinisolvens]